jgi:hypothetical protein
MIMNKKIVDLIDNYNVPLEKVPLEELANI